jgi:Na+-translocating ferredoxin:NAD+ oxidoreductase RnfG subunit
MNKFVKFPLVLGIVGVICTGALSLVYEITNPIIKDRINQEANAAILELIPDMDSANDLTNDYDSKVKNKYKVSSVKEVIKDNDTYAYAYQVSSVGKNAGIEMLVILDADEQKVLKVKVLSQSETGEYWDKVVANNVVASFEGLGFDDLTSVTDAKIGATLSVNGIAAGIENAISFQKYEILGEVDDGINLSGTERKKLGLPEGYTMTDKTEEFKATLKSKVSENYYNGTINVKAEPQTEYIRILNYIEIKDSSGAVVNYAYVAEGQYNVEGADGARLWQLFKFLFMFDTNGANTKVVVVKTTDTLSAVDIPSLDVNPWVSENFNGKTVAQLIDELGTDKIDKLTGATTTAYFIAHMAVVIDAHNKAYGN